VHVAPLQVDACSHTPGVQAKDVPPQTPAMHTSLAVHALPSLQSVPFGRGTFEHVPFAGLQAEGE
jgi:hypothetical protein